MMELDIMAREIGKLVNEYFRDWGTGRCVPRVTYDKYGIRKYVFRMSCQTLNRSAQYRCNDRMDVDSFRRELRLLLKRIGFTKCKVDVQKITIKGTAFGDETTYELNAIYFDR